MKLMKPLLQRLGKGFAALALLSFVFAAPASAQNFSMTTLAYLTDSVYDIFKHKNDAKYVPQGFSILKKYNDKSGVSAVLFEHTASHAVILSITGTQPNDFNDLLADLGIGKKEFNTAMRHLVDDMVQEAKWIPGKVKDGVKVTMHKLWGLDKNIMFPKCPKGSFFDLGTYACWSCPHGSFRSVAPVTTNKACQTKPQTHYAKADKKKKLKFKISKKNKCKKGQFWDAKGGKLGACWECPKGYTRGIVPVDKPKACVKITGLKFSKAAKVKSEKTYRASDVTAVPNKKLDRQVKVALAVVDDAAKQKKSNGQAVKLGEILVLGHSLGGFLTEVVVVKRKVKGGIAFNPPGARHYLKVTGNPRNLVNYSRKHDIVGRLGNHVGVLRLYPDYKFNWKKIHKFWPYQNHSMTYLKKDIRRGMKAK